MTGVALLSILAAACAAQSRDLIKPIAKSGGVERIGELQREIESLRSEAEALLQGLRPLRQEYPGAADLSRLEPRRSELRTALVDRFDRITVRRREYEQRVKDAQIYYGAMVISNLGAGKENRAAQDFNTILQNAEQRTSSKRFLSRLQDELDEDRLAYDAAAAERRAAGERRLALRRAAYAALALLLLFAGGTFALKRRWAAEFGLGLATPVPRALPDLSGGTPPAATSAAGRYRLLRESGPWPYGKAFEAEELGSGRRAIVKRLREGLISSTRELARLQDELNKTAALKNPYVASLYAVYVEDKTLHLAVEPLPGEPLSTALDAGRRIELKSSLLGLRQLIMALEHAHALGILHGELCPANIQLGWKGKIQVSDFGVGTAVRRAAARSGRRESPGNPAYMAPEVELGQVLKESDLYALAAVFYEMATGRLPFEGPNFLAQKREFLLHPPSRFMPEIPASLDAALLKALQPDPRQRFHSAPEFLAAVEAALKR